MHVEVDDRHPLQAVRLNCVPLRRPATLLKMQNPIGPRAGRRDGPGGPHAAEKRKRPFFLQHQIRGEDRRAPPARSAACRLQRFHRRVGVEGGWCRPAAANLADRLSRIRWDARARAARRWRAARRSAPGGWPMPEAISWSSIAASRSGRSGVTGTHLMLETIGVCDKCRARMANSSYPIACTLGRMLLKAEFQQQRPCPGRRSIARSRRPVGSSSARKHRSGWPWPACSPAAIC